MAYRLNTHQPLQDQVRRIGVEQINRALIELSAGEGAAIGKSVHETRKCFKRLRSLLHLIRPAIGETVFKQEDRHIRDIARTLATTRDLQVMTQTLKILELHPDANPVKTVFVRVQNELQHRRQQLEKNVQTTRIAETRQTLEKSRKRFGRLHLKSKKFATIADGLEATYESGRRHLKKAYKSGKAEFFHEWRKDVQRHWRHMQLLRSVWPEQCSTRIEEAKRLSLYLGDHNDLDILARFVANNKEAFAGDDNIDHFLNLCHGEKLRLRTRALPHGQRLYTERARPFAKRFAAYWKITQQLEETQQDKGEPTKSEQMSVDRPRPGKTLSKQETVRAQEERTAKIAESVQPSSNQPAKPSLQTNGSKSPDQT